jgi:hypothetical protein
MSLKKCQTQIKGQIKSYCKKIVIQIFGRMKIAI